MRFCLHFWWMGGAHLRPTQMHRSSATAGELDCDRDNHGEGTTNCCCRCRSNGRLNLNRINNSCAGCLVRRMVNGFAIDFRADKRDCRPLDLKLGRCFQAVVKWWCVAAMIEVKPAIINL